MGGEAEGGGGGMPWGAIASAGSSLISDFAQMGANNRANRRNRDMAENFWIADYMASDPSNVRRRIEDAGLNEQLMYGGGNAGGSTPNVAPPEHKPDIIPNVGAHIKGGFDQYFDYRLKDSELQAMEKNQLLVDTQIAKMQAETSESMFRTARSKFDLDLATELRNNSIGISSETYRGMQLQNSLKEIEKLQLPQKFKMEMAMDAQRLKNLSQTYDTEELEQEFKRIRNKYAKQGFNINNMGVVDSIFANAAGLGGKFKSVSDALEPLRGSLDRKHLKSYFNSAKDWWKKHF